MKKAENREVAAHILNCLRQHKTVKKIISMNFLFNL